MWIKVGALESEKQIDAMLSAVDSIIDRYQHCDEAEPADKVIRALYMKLWWLLRLERTDEAIAASSQLLGRLEQERDPDRLAFVGERAAREILRSEQFDEGRIEHALTLATAAATAARDVDDVELGELIATAHLVALDALARLGSLDDAEDVREELLANSNLVELARYDDALAVRDAQPGDAAAIGRIGRAVWPLVHEHLFGPEGTTAVLKQTYSDHSVAMAIERCAAAPDAHSLVAEHGGRVVGYLHFDNFGEEPELHRIYTDPYEREHGAGTALIDELHTRLGPGLEYVLMVAADNAAAQHFYRHHGLVEDHRVDAIQFYRKHMGVNFAPDARAVDAIVMRRACRARPLGA